MKAGKITSIQEQAILNEIATLKNKYNTGTPGTLMRDRRKQSRQNESNEFKSWLQSQGINPSILPFGGMGIGKGMGMGMRRGWEFGHKNWSTPTPTPA